MRKPLETLEECCAGTNNWGEELAGALQGCGLTRARSLPRLFYNRGWQCRIAAYSGGLSCAGAHELLRQPRQHLDSKHQLTGNGVGPRADEGEVVHGRNFAPS